MIELRVRLWEYALALLSVALALFFLLAAVTTWGLLVLVALGREASGDLDHSFWILLAASPVATAAFGWCVIDLLAIRIRFGEVGVERSIFGRRSLYPWASMTKINQHWAGATVIRLACGKRIPVPVRRKGSAALLEMADKNGVSIEI